MTSAILLLAGVVFILLWLLLREHAATVTRLESANAELHKQNDRLIETLTPALRRFDKSNEPPKTAEDILKAKHSISRAERSAKCSCGWVVESEDPAKLQAEIGAHWREHNVILRGGRNSWPQVKRSVEHHADEMAEQEIAKGAKQ